MEKRYDKMKPVLVSACLLGICCRYDGKEKANEAVLELLNRDDIILIPVCPEQWGGLQTPRLPSERKDGGVFNCQGGNVTEQYERGASQTLKAAKLYGCNLAILKERSPSCGKGRIYDGTFTGTLKDGHGVTAELLLDHGLQVLGESELEYLDKYLNEY